MLGCYYDDFCQVELRHICAEAKRMLEELARWSGWVVDPKKSSGPSSGFKWLGAWKELQARGVVTIMEIGRVNKIVAIIDGILASGRLTSAEASTLRGKYSFAAFGLFGKAGRVALRPLIDRQYAEDSQDDVTEPIRRSLIWMKWLLKVLPPARTELCGNRRPVIRIFSDASSEETRNSEELTEEYLRWLEQNGVAYGRLVQLGWLAFEDGECYCKGWCPVDSSFFDRMAVGTANFSGRDSRSPDGLERSVRESEGLCHHLLL